MDNEIEAYLMEEIVNPIKEALGYKSPITVLVSSSRTFNAAATDSGNIIINVGAIEMCKDVSELIGILAHEVAHIAGNHISTFISNNPDFMKAGLVTILLGAAAAVLAGNPTPLAAGLAGGQQMSRGMALAKMRQKENIADSKSTVAMKKLLWPVSAGFLSIHEKLGEKSAVYNVYESTHPTSQDRIAKFRQWNNEESEKQFPEDKIKLIQKMQRKFLLIKEKIKALTLSPSSDIVLASTMAQKYALAIFLYRQSHFKAALALTEEVMNSEMDDSFDPAYVAEIKSMALIGLKKYKEAADFAYSFLKKARKNKVYRDLGIIYADAVVQGELGKSYYKQSIRILRKILLKNKYEISAYNVLGKIYTLDGRYANASLCAAEVASMIGDYEMAAVHAKKAKNSSNDEILKREATDIINTRPQRE